MNLLSNELKIEIFKYLDEPISIILTDRKWYSISKDSYTRAKWLIHKYGKTYAFFHAVRLGKDFISPDVVQALVGLKAILSRYFIQRLMLQFALLNEQVLNNLRSQVQVKYGNNQSNANISHKLPWACDLSNDVFTKLISEASNSLDKHLTLGGNDMDLFRFLTGAPYTIDIAPKVFFSNFDMIQDLILNKNFIPFPPRLKSCDCTTSTASTSTSSTPSSFTCQQGHLSKDGYENNLHLIARAILIYPELARMWRKIGYDDVCIHYNTLVMNGCVLLLFPPHKPTNWTCPEINTIVESFKILIGIGFKLTGLVMRESIRAIESNKNSSTNEVMTLINAFNLIRGDPSIELTISSCFNSSTDIMAFNKRRRKENSNNRKRRRRKVS